MTRILPIILILCASGFAAFAQSDLDIRRDVVYGHKDGLALTFDVITPKQDSNGEGSNGIALLYVFSSGYDSVWIDPSELVGRSAGQGGRFATVLDAGFTLFMVRHGSNPKFTVPEIVDDLRRAVRFVRVHASDFAIDPERIGMFGNSAGGHITLMIATDPRDGNPEAEDPIDRVSDRIAAAVVYYPPVDLRGRVKPDAAIPAMRFNPGLDASLSPLLHISPGDAPTLFIHGDKDELVPLSQSESMHAAMQAAELPTELIVIEGAGHGFQGAQSQRAAQALTQWFERFLITPDE